MVRAMKIGLPSPAFGIWSTVFSVTARLLVLLGEGAASGREALVQIAEELAAPVSEVIASGKQTLEHLASCDIIAGTRTSQ